MVVVYGNDYRSPILSQLSHIPVLSIEEFKNRADRFSNSTQICATHEEAVEAIQNSFPEHPHSKAYRLFRNKAELRKKSRELTPNFFFKPIKLDDLSKQQLDFSSNSKFVIKPTKGFFSVGVHFIDSQTDLVKLQTTLVQEIQKQQEQHPEYISSHALSTEDFLIESYISGSEDSSKINSDSIELAVDGYYNSEEEFTLLTLYHHPYRSDRKYFHTLYYTNQELYERFSDLICQFFYKLKSLLQLELKCFPLHAEFKFVNGKLFLIEVNPGRWGGLGLTDLNYYAFHQNNYRLFFNNHGFDWKKQWQSVPSKTCFAWVLAYNGKSFNSKNTQFDHLSFQKFLGNLLLHYEVISYDSEVAAIGFLKKNHKNELSTISELEFDQFMLNSSSRLPASTCDFS